MGFYLRCRRLQSGAAAQADSGGLLMAKISGFAKAFAGRAAHCRNGHQATLANTAEFFNSLLVHDKPDTMLRMSAEISGTPSARAPFLILVGLPIRSANSNSCSVWRSVANFGGRYAILVRYSWNQTIRCVAAPIMRTHL